MTRGLSDIQIARIRINFLTDTCKIEQQTAATGDGKATWSVIDQPTTPCRVIERNGFTYSGNAIDQQYNAEIILGGEVPLVAKGPQYRLTVLTYKPDPDDPQGGQIVDRTYTYLAVNIEAMRDASGAHVFQRVRVKNA